MFLSLLCIPLKLNNKTEIQYKYKDFWDKHS